MDLESHVAHEETAEESVKGGSLPGKIVTRVHRILFNACVSEGTLRCERWFPGQPRAQTHMLETIRTLECVY